MLGRMKGLVQKAIANTSLEPTVRRLWGKVSHRHAKYDILTKRILEQEIRPNSNCIDIGCHVGMVLDDIIALAPHGWHNAFEPLPHFAHYLEKKYGSNPRVTIHDVALSDQTGSVDFVYNVDHPDYSGFREREYPTRQENVRHIKVPTARLDDIIPPSRTITLMKIDVEGAELGVMRGALGLLNRDKPTVVFEHGLGASNFYNTTPDQVFDLLVSAGLNIWLLDSFLGKMPSLTKEELASQYNNRFNHYFVAHKPMA